MPAETDVLNEWYNSFAAFVEKYNHLYLSELDYYITKNLNLYAVYEQADFTEIKVASDRIRATLPAIGRIFSKPIIHLIEQDDILPVESVHFISSNAIDHIASHSELWQDVTEEGIQPRKLLSRSYADNYSIYENIVFANTIDMTLSYIRSKAKTLEDLMFSLKLREMNILDRGNHLDYYLALGKLHTGYIRNYDLYLAEANSLKENLLRYYHKISSRLYKRVYRYNKNKKITSLHKTNILSMDKDYKKIYRLCKLFSDHQQADYLKWISFDNDNYYWFAEILLLFSIEHFGFSEDKRAHLDCTALDFDFSARVYHLNVKSVTYGSARALLLTFRNDKPYTIALIPLCRYVKRPSAPAGVTADEVVFLSPLEADNVTLASITELDSFRRIQQILLRGMIYSTERFELCPFCMGELVKEEESERYLCPSCNEIIEKLTCPEKETDYYNTDVKDIDSFRKKEVIFDVESRLNFRNINRLTQKAFYCPVCKKVH